MTDALSKLVEAQAHSFRCRCGHELDEAAKRTGRYRVDSACKALHERLSAFEASQGVAVAWDLEDWLLQMRCEHCRAGGPCTGETCDTLTGLAEMAGDIGPLYATPPEVGRNTPATVPMEEYVKLRDAALDALGAFGWMMLWCATLPPDAQPTEKRIHGDMIPTHRKLQAALAKANEIIGGRR